MKDVDTIQRVRHGLRSIRDRITEHEERNGRDSGDLLREVYHDVGDLIQQLTTVETTLGDVAPGTWVTFGDGLDGVRWRVGERSSVDPKRIPVYHSTADTLPAFGYPQDVVTIVEAPDS